MPGMSKPKAGSLANGYKLRSLSISEKNKPTKGVNIKVNAKKATVKKAAAKNPGMGKSGPRRKAI